MRKFVRIVDENGLFIEDAFVDELTEFTIETPCPSGFYKPKWNGEKWVEGLSEEEIAEITKPSVQEPTETDYLMLAMTELAKIVLGGM